MSRTRLVSASLDRSPAISRQNDIARIHAALEGAAEIARRYDPETIEVKRKAGGSPVTEADHLIDDLLREILPEPGDGWLSEETRDDRSRLACRRVWIVDPIDGTKEFTQGIPEWCISIGLVEDGVAVAGGICNPARGELVLGSLETGVTLNGEAVRMPRNVPIAGARVMASRSEVKRGEWERFADAEFQVVPCGSVAYKLGVVAAGLFEATWTLVPKNEWDVAAGAALVTAAGGQVLLKDGTKPVFNRENTLLPGFCATPDPAHSPDWGPFLSRLLAT
ncbi:MAG: 3'(2'),5'-bisphosphate nucleotidase CysQ [Planctomycetes bacterium]|nr:3'(2'),5'-bisphosphate nucleotidase CysQ [Planctomycetota bacterium]